MAEALDTTLDQADIESNWTETVESFDALELNEDLLRGIYAYGFEKPSAIQQKGILPLIRGRDSICQAQSGTGKTATFAIGVLQRIDIKNRTCQALLLAPTRELAQQIQKLSSSSVTSCRPSATPASEEPMCETTSASCRRAFTSLSAPPAACTT